MRVRVGSLTPTKLVHRTINLKGWKNWESSTEYLLMNSSRSYPNFDPPLLSPAVQRHSSYSVRKRLLKRMMKRKLVNGVAACLQALSLAGHTTYSLSSTLLLSFAHGMRNILTFSYYKSLLKSIRFGKPTVDSIHFQYEVFCLRQLSMSHLSISKLVLDHPILLALTLSYCAVVTLTPLASLLAPLVLLALGLAIIPKINQFSSGVQWDRYSIQRKSLDKTIQTLTFIGCVHLGFNLIYLWLTTHGYV